jgi:O-succinylbenzoic acid--CoA ligase
MAVDVMVAAGGRSDAPALVTPTRWWTYRQLDSAVEARARELRAEGVVRGRVVAAVVESDSEGILWLLALWRVGAVPAPLNPRLTGSEAQSAISTLTEAPDGAQVVVWTSGTAGRPRGVALSYENLAASAQGAADRLALTDQDVWLASLSLAHVGGLALLTRSLLLGGTLVATGRFDAGTASELLDGRGLPVDASAPLTHMSLVPTQLLRLLEHRRGAPPPDTFRCALIGGAHAPAELVARAHRAGWPLALTYGATEMSSQATTAPPELTRRKAGTVGPPLKGVEIRIGDDGEILARGETRAIGYVGVGDGTSAKDVLSSLGTDSGWYRTGDLGHLDEDGDLWVTGRRADRIVSGGVTIDAVEVEEALRGHPSVVDASVVGVPDATWGEKVAAWIEPVVGEFDVEEVLNYLRPILSAPKMPRVWHVEGDLPRNANGKVDRVKVRDAFDAE